MSILKRLLVIAVLLFIIPMAILYFFQENIIFRQPSLSEERLTWLRENFPEAEEVTLETPEGITLHGWFVNHLEEDTVPLIIYFGGNNQEVSQMLEMAYRFENWALLALNYRGYGLSEGQPGQDEIFRDAVFVYDAFTGQEDVDPERIVVMGWSLGSGPAVYLSKHREIAGTILVSPFDSLTRTASKTIPLLPMSLILRHPFDSLSRAAHIDVPALALVASEDRLIRPSQSRRLMASWGGPWQLEVIEGRAHNDIFFCQDYWKHINAFLEGFE